MAKIRLAGMVILRATFDHRLRWYLGRIPARAREDPSLGKCQRNDSVTQVMSIMTDRRIRHLPAVDEGKLVGIISIGDVVKQRLAEVESDADQLREYITTG